MANKVTVVGTIGNPGQTESATFSPLDRGDYVDVGAMIAKEIEDLPNSEPLTLDGEILTFDGETITFEGV